MRVTTQYSVGLGCKNFNSYILSRSPRTDGVKTSRALCVVSTDGRSLIRGLTDKTAADTSTHRLTSETNNHVSGTSIVYDGASLCS